MAGKSIEDILRQQEEQRSIRIQEQKIQEQKIQEQAERQRREHLNRMKMYETVASTSVSSAAGAAGGITSILPLYLFGSITSTQNNEYDYILLDFNLNKVETDLPFYGTSVFALNTDDNQVYFVSKDEYTNDRMIFGKMNTFSKSITIIDDINLTSLSVRTPSSLIYIGNNEFIYTDSLPFFDFESAPNTFLLNTSGTCSLISTSDTSQEYLSNLFILNGELWGAAIYGNTVFSGIGRYNLEDGVFIDFNEVVINDFPDISMSKVWWITSTINIKGKVYCNMIVMDKTNNTPVQCIAELNTETYEAYFIKQIDFDQNYLYIDITTF